MADQPVGVGSVNPLKKGLLYMIKATAVAMCLCLLSWPGGCGGQTPPVDEATTGNDGGGNPLFRGFNSMSAFQYLDKQVAFGPRPPGSAAHEQLRAYLVTTLGQWTTVTQQNFKQIVSGTSYDLTNLLGVIPAATRGKGSRAPRRLLLSAHWDTRPTADQDPDPARRNQPILGANDAGSGVAVLLEVARLLHEEPPPVEVVIALWDGEDFGNYLYGSTYFADNMGAFRPDWAINLDMIGDADLHVNREVNSLNAAADLFAAVLRAADDLGLAGRFDGASLNILDDHIPLIRKGIKAIDLIEFDYGPNNSYWHTHADTADKCSAESLQALGEVVLRVTYGLQ